MISLLQSRRATTLAEAINTYEDEMHKRRLEDMEMQKVAAAQTAANAQVRAADAQQRSALAQEKSAKAMQASVAEQKKAIRELGAAARDLSFQQSSSGGGGKESTKGTVTCIFCRKRISNKASVCPYCGNHAPTTHGMSPGEMLGHWFNGDF